MRFKVLGPIEAEREGQLVAIGGPQQRRLLAVLLVERGRVVSTDRLVAALWPDGQAPDGAARSTMSYVSRLRAALGETSIATQASGYRLDVNGDGTDVEDFERLVDEARRALPDVAVERYEEALGLWRGAPYGEFADEWWALAEVRRLTELEVIAREQRAAAMIAVGHYNLAIPDLEALVADEQLRETPVRLFMQALFATGRQADALRAARRFRARLADETGLEPSAAVASLEQSILHGVTPPDHESARPLRGYTMHEVIGEGAFGTVYAATQPETGRRVAIKVIRPALADAADFVRRFDGEARLVARLEHPHIVPLYDYWREPGGAYLVFRHLTGGTARDSLIAGGPWSLARVSRLVEEVGGALIAAHAAGVTHNDVRTANVLLDDVGCSYLADFGIASDGGDEQADVRAFGLLIGEMLTGSPASAGDDERPPSVGPVPGAAGVDAVLARATSMDGGYANVAEVVLGWRAAVGRPEGVLSPVGSDERRAVGETRRRDARRLAEDTAAASNPYVGLRPFDEADVSRFFGRQAIVDSLVELAGRHAVVTVVGPSGSGKSSIARAGVVPRLRAEGRTVVVMVPGHDPVEQLRIAVSEVATERAEDRSIGELIGAVAERGPLTIVVDQFEECWTQAADGRREQFIELLATAADAGAVGVIATIRADLFDRPLQDPIIGELVSDGTFAVPPMSPGDLREAIVLPAARVGVSIDDAVVAALLAESASRPGALPLLQFTLAELYARRTDGSIRSGQLDAVGGMAGAIGRRAESIHESLEEPGRVAARELFRRLVVPGGQDVDTRRRARLAELPDGARSMVGPFAEARLLVADRDATTREPTVEIAHEALITRWARLATWIDEDRRWIAQLQHLASAARAWDEGGRLDADLYRGSRLEAIVESIAAGRTVTATERKFVDAGVTGRDEQVRAARRSARRLRRSLVGVAAALVIALVAGAVALVQRARAEDAARAARIEALVGRAGSIRATQRDTAALLAVEAFRLADTPSSRSALLSTFTDGQGFLDTHRLAGDRGGTGIVLPDGSSTYVVGDDGRIRRYGLDSGRLGQPLAGVNVAGDPAPVLAASPDGAQLAIVARSDAASTVTVVDMASGTTTFPPIIIDGRVESASFANSGGRLALVRGDDAELLAVDARNGDQVAALRKAPPNARGSTFVRPDDMRDALYFRGPSSSVVADGDRFVVGSLGGSLRVVDAESAALVVAMELPPNTVSVLRPVGDGTLVTAGRSGLTRVDVATGEVVWERAELESCTSLAVVAERDTFYCSDPFGRLVERDLSTGLPVRQLDAQHGTNAALWAAHGATELVAFGASEPVVLRWRLDGSGPITRLVAPGYDVDSFSPNGRRLIVGAGLTAETADFRVVDVPTGDVVFDLRPSWDQTWAGDDTIDALALAPDGRIQPVRFELAASGAQMAASRPAFAPEDALVDREPGKRRLLIGLRRGDSVVLQAATHLDGLLGPQIVVTDEIVSTSISRTGHRIAVGTAQGVTVYDGATGEAVGAIPVTALQGVAITVADQLFVSSLGGELFQYELKSLRPVRAFGGSRGLVQDLIGSADGSLIVFRGGDRSVAVHDVASGVRLGTPIQVRDDAPNLIGLAEQGDRLAIGGGPDGVQLWELDPERWVTAACGVAGRNLTADEWRTHVGALAPYRATCPDLPFDARRASITHSD